MCVCIPILQTTFPEWLSGTIVAHTQHRASVLVVFVVFCMHMYSFAVFSPRSVTLQSPNLTLIPLFSSSELTGCGYPGLLDWKNHSDMCPRWELNLHNPFHACHYKSDDPYCISSAIRQVFSFQKQSQNSRSIL